MVPQSILAKPVAPRYTSMVTEEGLRTQVIREDLKVFQCKANLERTAE